MYHKRGEAWCWAWDVDDSAYRFWKEGNGPLSALYVYLPNGEHPTLGSQVVCGTCKTSNVIPMEMKQEFLRQ